MAYINKTVREKILELREQGRTYQSIADEIGCSKQYVGLVFLIVKWVRAKRRNDDDEGT